MKKWLLLLALYALVAAAAALGWLGADHAVQQPGMEGLPPGRAAWLGTDHLGRDVLARVLQGARIALAVGVLAAGLSVGLGALLGVLAGWFRGPLDGAALWLGGAVAAIPAVLLILAIGFMLGRGFASVFLAIGLVSWVGVFRLVRAEVMRQRSRDYVLAARAAGAGAGRVLAVHVVPHLLPLLALQFALHFVYAVKTEVVVSFLGVGMVEEPSWGAMIAFAADDLLRGRWWPLAAATVALFGLVLAVQRLADRLRDRLDPGHAAAAPL